MIIESILSTLALAALVVYVRRDPSKDREREVDFARSITGIDLDQIQGWRKE